MTLTTFVPGVNTSFSTQLNANYVEAYTIAALNLIRQLQDRTVTFSKGSLDWWGEAYIDSNGRMNSVNTTLTTNYYRTITSSATCEADFVNTAGSDTLHDPDSFTTPANAFDEDLATAASKGDGTHSLGNTFSTKSISRVYWMVGIRGGTGDRAMTVKLQSYNGSIWSDVSTLVNNQIGAVDYSGIYNTEIVSVQGLRLNIASSSGNGAATKYVYELQYNTVGVAAETEIVHTIPAGTFSSTASKAIGVPMVADWETGADIQYKLDNLYTGGNLSGGELPVSATTYIEYGNYIVNGTTSPSVDLDIRCNGGTGSYTTAYARVTFYYQDGTSLVTAEQSTNSESYVTKTFTNTSPSKVLARILVEVKNENSPYTIYANDLVAVMTTVGPYQETGWLACGITPAVSSFTAFTSEPTTLIVKLIPKASSPTAGYPAIYGFAVRAA